MRPSILLAFVQFLPLFLGGQTPQQEILNLESLHPLPGKELPAPTDISARVKGYATPDSLIFEIVVTDDQVVFGKSDEAGDRVEIWLSAPTTSFTDYLVSDFKGKPVLYRNSNDPSSTADLDRFLKNGDYPKGKLKNPETGLEATPQVPAGNTLRFENVFYGVTRFAFHPDNRKAKHLDRSKYKLMEKKLGFTVDDLSGSANYTSQATGNGYKMRIAMHNRCIGFAQAVLMNKLSFVVDVVDIDTPEGSSTGISSSKNRFYGRPSYFNKAELPFKLNISINVPDSTIKKLGIEVLVIASDKIWKPYGFTNGPIIYAPEFSSEADLCEFSFYPVTTTYQKTTPGQDPAFELVTQTYKDDGAFTQRDLYFIVNNKVFPSKGYTYLERIDGDFVNSVFRLPDGGTALVLYDYEPADPLGWGEYGKLADEFVYIQKIDAKGDYPIFNAGHRIENIGKATFGEKDAISLDGVKSVSYSWKTTGKKFEINVTGKTKASNRKLIFEIGADQEFHVVK
jgi:hypothetical protein